MTRRVLLCGAWDEGPGYPRTSSLRQALLASGAEVRECRIAGIGRDKQRLWREPWRWPAVLWHQRRQRAALWRALARDLDAFAPDCVLVPYPGHGLVSAIRRRTRAKVVLDLFLSAYDTVVEDRGLALPGSLLARGLQWLDTRACAAADLVLLDTPDNAAYVQALTGLEPARFAWLPVGDPDAPQHAAPWRAPGGDRLELLFFGTGVPLHGLSVLLDAVVMAPEVRLLLIGGGERERRRAAELGERVQLGPAFVPRGELARHLDRAQLVAGVFGTPGSASSKAQRVVPFKVVHALSAGRPVLTADTPAIARWLDGSGAVFTTPTGDPVALAQRLRWLAANPEALVGAAAAARPAYERVFSPAALGVRIDALLGRLLGSRREVAA